MKPMQMIGHVYLLLKVATDGMESYKIGISKNDPSKRVKQLQTGNDCIISLLKSYKSKNYNKIEKMLHNKYKLYVTEAGNEWFNLPPTDVIRFQETCKETDELVSYLKETNPFF
jgi:hypothetical protein